MVIIQKKPRIKSALTVTGRVQCARESDLAEACETRPPPRRECQKVNFADTSSLGARHRFQFIAAQKPLAQ